MSKIAWTHRTWNPTVGCTRVSAGCEHCYAERMAWRLANNPKTAKDYRGVVTKTSHGSIRWTGEVNQLDDRLFDPYTWSKPSLVFVNSMSDLFHESIDFDFPRKVWLVMKTTPQHTYQILTKRPEQVRMGIITRALNSPPLPNVWIGVSVENQQTANIRIPYLFRAASASVRFLSVEPLLEQVELNVCDCDWVIIGGESGKDARPMKSDWARWIIDQCQRASVPVFFKQTGAVLAKAWGLKDRKGADPSEWPNWCSIQEYPKCESGKLAKQERQA